MLVVLVAIVWVFAGREMIFVRSPGGIAMASWEMAMRPICGHRVTTAECVAVAAPCQTTPVATVDAKTPTQRVQLAKKSLLTKRYWRSKFVVDSIHMDQRARTGAVTLLGRTARCAMPLRHCCSVRVRVPFEELAWTSETRRNEAS